MDREAKEKLVDVILSMRKKNGWTIEDFKEFYGDESVLIPDSPEECYSVAKEYLLETYEPDLLIDILEDEVLWSDQKDKSESKEKREEITWWTIKMSWNNGDEEYLSDIPNWVAKPVDEYLTTLEEEERNEDN